MAAKSGTEGKGGALEKVAEVAEVIADPVIGTTKVIARVLVGVDGPGREPVLPHEAFDTTGPTKTESGLVKCDLCSAEVPYASMGIFAFGYLCARCAARNG